jgi:adenine-specific DNA-methyltransferase
MGKGKQKLELTWIGKNNPEYDITNIEPRILEERRDLSYGDPNTENMIIHGDNLLALKALLPEYEGKIKCIYIDPPYNTGNAFEHYDDSVEHSTWLSLMKPRLEMLKMLLSEDGVIWISIDDQELYYLKALVDEVFNGVNFVTTICIKTSSINGLRTKNNKPTKVKDYLLFYAKDISKFTYKQQFEFDDNFDHYSLYLEKNSINNSEQWIVQNINDVLTKELGVKSSKLVSDNARRSFILKNFRNIYSSQPIADRLDRIKFARKNPDIIQIYTNPDGSTLLMYKNRILDPLAKKFKIIDGKSMPAKLVGDLWSDIKYTGIDSEGGVKFTNGKKPEKLIQRIIESSSEKGHWVLDSFLGSGTTAATAQKLNRKYIGIEMGEHAYSHVQKRLQAVTDGTDQSGISRAIGWKGGGGFKFYELAPSFVAIDEFGNPVIDSYYNDTKLIRAMCKLMNYTFSPSTSEYWKQGKGQGNNNIYVTTQMLSVAMVQQIASHLSKDETLLICPKKYEPGSEKVDMRITIKKIPQSILKACHFGRKEYLLPIKERAIEELDDEDITDDES